MKNIFATTISIIVISLLLVFLNPTHLLMPDTLHSMLIIGFIITFLLLIAILWKERANDEREATHIQKSGRFSFIAGATILFTGIVIQTSMHNIDPWLIRALLLMILVKILSRVYFSHKN